MITVREIIKSVFKKKLIVNTGNHNSVRLRPTQNLKYDLPRSILDPLRGRLNTYWNEGKFVGLPSAQIPLGIEFFPADSYENGNILGSFRQKFKLTPKTFTFTDLEWKRFISKTFNNDGSNGVLSQQMIDKLETIRQIFLSVKNSNPNPNKVIISQTSIDNEFVPVYNEPRITFSAPSKFFIQRVINRTEFEKRQGYALNDQFKAGIDAVLLDIQRILPIEAGLGAEWILDDPRNDPKYLETEAANIAQRLYNLLKTKQGQNSSYFIPQEVGFLNRTADENKIKIPYSIVPRIKELAQNFSVIYPGPENRDFILNWAKIMTDFNRSRITEVSVDGIIISTSTEGSSDNFDSVGRENCDIQGAGSNTGEIGQGLTDRLETIFGGSSYTPSSKVRDSISIGTQIDGTLVIESGFLPGAVVNILDDTSRPEGPDTIREGVLFNDFTFEANVPYSKKEVGEGNIGSNAVYDLFPEYNYYIQKFEDSIDRPSVDETHLPNLYSFAIEKQENNLDAENTIFNQHITLSGYIKHTFTDVINAIGKKIGEKSTGQYFEKFANEYDSFLEDPASRVMREKFSNIIYPADSANIFQDVFSTKEMFPMSINLDMNMDNLSKIVSLFNEINISTKLIKDTISNNISVSRENFFTRLTSVEQVIGQMPVDRLQTQKVEDLNVYDITEWIEANLEDPSANIGNENNSVVFSQVDPLDQGLGQDMIFENFLSNIVLIGKVKDLIKEKIRSFEDIMTGKKCYSEVLFYKIEKKDSAGTTLQTFYISNSNKVAVLNFIDTQVKYNKKYKYQIYSCNLVIGNKYRYNIESIQNQSALVEAIISPSVVIVEVPLIEKIVRIFDLPPIAPDVNLVPLKDNNDRIKILLNSGIGRFTDFPIIIEEGDGEFFKTEREVQGKEEDEPIDFNSDDPPQQFQVFRTDERPTKYSDFENKLVAVIDTLHNGVRLSSGEYLDILEPNTKYWYVFRSIDIHDNISNPSPVYEVEIVDDGGAVYPLISTIEMKVEKKQKKTKQARKLIFIRPTLSQGTINEIESNLFDVDGNAIETVKGKEDFVLGIEDEKVWGKNYKIRLTSRKTGRKIDVNVSFAHKTRQLRENE